MSVPGPAPARSPASRAWTPAAGATPRGLAASAAAREQRELHGCAPSRARVPVRSGWAREASAASPAAGAPPHARGPPPGPLADSYARSPASRARQGGHRTWGVPQAPPQTPLPPAAGAHGAAHGAASRGGPPTSGAPPGAAQPRLLRTASAPAAVARGFPRPGQPQDFAYAGYPLAVPPHQPGPMQMPAAYDPYGYAPVQPYPPQYYYPPQPYAHPPPHGYSAAPAYVPPAPPSAARPLNPHHLAAINGPAQRGMSEARERLLREHAGVSGGRSLAPAANPLSPAEINARRRDLARAAQEAAGEGADPLMSRAANELRRRNTNELRRRNMVASPPTAEDEMGASSGSLTGSGDLTRHASYTPKEVPAWARPGAGGIPKMSPARSGFKSDEHKGVYAPSRRMHRAVVVGITYEQSRQHQTLRGSLSDVVEVFRMLVDTFGFDPDSIRVLCDAKPACDARDLREPTLEGIIAAMKWVNEGAAAGDAMFFYFAGHGTVVKDYSGDERDTDFDQCLVPIDKDVAGPIVDDHIFEWLVRRVPFGARLTCLVDACTSGTVCDLPFLHTRRRGHRRQGLGSAVDNTVEAAEPPRHALKPNERVGETLLYAGSADMEKAADITRDSISFGVMTRSFIESIKALLRMQADGATDFQTSFGVQVDIIQSFVNQFTIAEPDLAGELPQEPQLSSSHMLEMFDTRFSL